MTTSLSFQTKWARFESSGSETSLSVFAEISSVVLSRKVLDFAPEGCLDTILQFL